MQGTRPAEDLDGRIGQANMAIQILGARVEAGVLTIPQYLDQLRGGVAREMQVRCLRLLAGEVVALRCCGRDLGFVCLLVVSPRSFDRVMTSIFPIPTPLRATWG